MTKRLLLTLSVTLLPYLSVAQSPVKLIRQMIDSAAVLKGFRAEITLEERIEGKISKKITASSLRKEPYGLYLYQLYPKEGVEVLVHSMDEKPLINLNAFPWFNLSLDPYGTLMRKNQHHTIYDSGFDLLMSTLKRELDLLGSNTSNVTYKGIVEWDGRPAHQIEVAYPDYGKKLYKVMMGEDVNTIARKLNVNEYSILELNKNLDFYDDVHPGDEIMVPTSYAKRMVLLIDVKYMLPMVTKVYDDKGLYEQYAYRKFILNPKFEPGEFEIGYKEYGF